MFGLKFGVPLFSTAATAARGERECANDARGRRTRGSRGSRRSREKQRDTQLKTKHTRLPKVAITEVRFGRSK